jgi:hypothetical protein
MRGVVGTGRENLPVTRLYQNRLLTFTSTINPKWTEQKVNVRVFDVLRLPFYLL